MSLRSLRVLALIAVMLSPVAFGCGGAQQDAAQPSKPGPAAPSKPTAPAAGAAPATAAATAAATLASQQKGADLYKRICSVCHGPGGEGYKADQAPALYHPEFLTTVSDAYLRSAIMYGRLGSTMSAWSVRHGGPLSDQDVDAVIAYLRSWQKTPNVGVDEHPLKGDKAHGADLYARECAQCHGAHGIEGPNIRIGDMTLLAGLSNGFLRRAIANGRSGTPMPSFQAKLGEQGIDDVIAFLHTLPALNAANTPAHVPDVKPPPLPLGPVPLNPKGPEPRDFKTYPETTSVEVVHAQLERKARMAFLDARAPSDYANEHISGAVSVPFYDPSPYLAKLPKNAWLVCYCACPHAESGELATKLQAAGFKKVTVLTEGLGVWRLKKYGTTKGNDP